MISPLDKLPATNRKCRVTSSRRHVIVYAVVAECNETNLKEKLCIIQHVVQYTMTPSFATNLNSNLVAANLILFLYFLNGSKAAKNGPWGHSDAAATAAAAEMVL